MKKWRCVVCGYVHQGDQPPEVCPICGVDASNFQLVEESKPTDHCAAEIAQALRNISYGLYIITSHKDGLLNGQCANTVFQITSDPVKVAIGINKNNLTHEYIQSSQVFSVAVLDTNGLALVKNFGYRSGREVDKFDQVDYELSEVNTPLIKDSLATLTCKVVGSLDMGTHTLFVGEVLCAENRSAGQPMTYSHYHRIKNQ